MISHRTEAMRRLRSALVANPQDLTIRNQLIELYLPAVLRYARRLAYGNAGVEEDLSDAFLWALTSAARGYDPHLAAFNTYLWYKLRTAYNVYRKQRSRTVALTEELSVPGPNPDELALERIIDELMRQARCDSLILRRVLSGDLTVEDAVRAYGLRRRLVRKWLQAVGNTAAAVELCE